MKNLFTNPKDTSVQLRLAYVSLATIFWATLAFATQFAASLNPESGGPIPYSIEMLLMLIGLSFFSYSMRRKNERLAAFVLLVGSLSMFSASAMVSEGRYAVSMYLMFLLPAVGALLKVYWYKYLVLITAAIITFSPVMNHVNTVLAIDIVLGRDSSLIQSLTFLGTLVAITVVSEVFFRVTEDSTAKLRDSLKKQRELNSVTTKLLTKDTKTGLKNGRELPKAHKLNSSNNYSLIAIELLNEDSIISAFGPDVFDKYLKSVAKILSRSFGEDKTYRHGDRFYIYEAQSYKSGTYEIICRKIKKIFSAGTLIHGHTVKSEVSIAVVSGVKTQDPINEAYKKCFITMIHAKETESKMALYDEQMDEDLKRKQKVTDMLKAAIRDKELTLHFQPIMNAATGEIAGAEALIRWFSKELGFIPPDQFISIAEENGLIDKIGNFVAQEAISFARRIQINYDSNFFISINVSPIQLENKSFAMRIKQLIEYSSIDPSLVNLEVTESQELGSNDAQHQIQLKNLSDFGCKIAIDDFGTGYSNLSNLNAANIGKLKIDRSFVTDLDKNSGNKKIINAIVRMAESLGIETVAEGMETVREMETLKELGVDYFQGYYFSKPLSESDFVQLMAGAEIAIVS